MASGASAAGLTIATGGAGQAIGSLVGPVVEAGKCVYHCLKRKYDYIKKLNQNFQNFEKQKQRLSSRAEDVKGKIAEVTHEPTNECNTWLEHVKEETEKAEKLRERYESFEEAVKGSCGPCSFRTRLKLSKDLVKMTRDMEALHKNINPNLDVLGERRQNQVPRRSQMNIVQVPSLDQHVKRLVEYLKDPSIKKIGIWGSFGVGKTTILESLKEKVEKLQPPLFNVVLQVAVPKESYDLCKMQCEILKDLGVHTEHQNQAENLISSTLEGKKYLLLLDDVSSYSVKENRFKLCDIGFRDSHEHCKVVLATREREICKSMGTDEEIRVDKLSREDARKLFFDTLGEEFDRPYFKRMAERVLKQCGDLPQVVRAVGNHLKDKHNEQSWKDVLLDLQSPNMFTLGHLGEVYSVFNTIYEKLDGRSKNCFLYTASFPDDHEIYQDYLIECWQIEQLIGLHKTFRHARTEGYGRLNTFIDGYLFDRGRSSKHVKMPIIFRNAARKVADANNFALLVKESGDLEEFPPVELWSNAKVLSLVNSELAELPHKPMPVCSVLSTLFLQKNKKLSEIPPSFFGCMSSLKLLDLSGTGINSLPASISNLTSLKGLYLNDCSELVDLPGEMEHLQNLELLDLRHSRVHGCHDVVAGLINLRCLRAGYKSVIGNQNCVKTNGPVATPSNTIEQLVKLEELTIDKDPRDIEWSKIALKVAEQVATLQKLSTLSFYFPSTESLEMFTQNSIPWKRDISPAGDNFTPFNFYVYSEETNKSPTVDVSECTGERYLFYSDGKDIPDVIKEVVSRIRAVELIAHQSIQDISELGIEGTKELEICRVEGCNKMLAFLGSQMPSPPVFEQLKELYLCQLQHLNAIFQGPVPLDSFARLRTLAVDDCPNLTELLSLEMAKQLLNLEHLKVKNCPRVEKIVATNSQSTDGGKFLKLKILELEKLGGLNSIHSNAAFEWPELQKVRIDQCDKLLNLFLSTTNASKLHRIECRRGWWEQLTDDKANLKDFFYFTD